MIYQPQPQQEGCCLFAQPEQLLHLKDQLLLLLQRNQNNRYFSNHQPNTYFMNDPQIKQNEDVSGLFSRLQQNQQLIVELNTQMLTLGELAIKMIDYITEMHQKRMQDTLKHENQMEALAAQLQSATHKNQLIQGDIQLFRERLMVAQSEMEGIQKSQLEKELSQQEDYQNQQKILLLEQQLQRLKEHLNACKAQYTHKQTDLISSPRLMKATLSQKLFQIKRRSTINTVVVPHQQQVLESLREKIKMLQYQNQTLRQQIDSFKSEKQEVLDYIPDQFQENYNFIEQNSQAIIEVPKISPQSFAKVTSFSLLKSSAKEEQQSAQQLLASHQSVEKFHTLSNEWSHKSFQNLGQFNIESHLTNLIYLNNDDQDKQNQANCCIPETKETQNSLPDSELNSMQKKHKKEKVMCEKEVNTQTWAELEMQMANLSKINEIQETRVKYPTEIRQQTEEQPQDVQAHADSLNKSLKSFVNSIFSLKLRAVDMRISKGLHEPKIKTHNRNVSYYY